MELKVQYKKEMNHDYLLLKLDESAENNFRIHMLEQNQIPGLLPLLLRRVDNQLYGYYEITGLESLNDCFQQKRMNQFDIQFLMIRLTEAAENVDQFLLFEQEIVLDAEFIYTNHDYTELYFCYYPIYRQSIQEGLIQICRFILDHVNYEERMSVKMAYLLYQEGMKENAAAEKLTSFISDLIQHEGEENEDKKASIHVVEVHKSEGMQTEHLVKSEENIAKKENGSISNQYFQEEISEEIKRSNEEDSSQKYGKSSIWIGIGVIIGGILLGGGLYLVFQKELSKEDRRTLLIILILFGAAMLCLIVKFVSDHSD